MCVTLQKWESTRIKRAHQSLHHQSPVTALTLNDDLCWINGACNLDPIT
uniref:F16A14.16 n=1 Tax=Arabidopsis thaliana TaxID=3702 RepID=Q9LMG3_ARATH|nr:F16A14.16 [Arabidopsis thaliana]